MGLRTQVSRARRVRREGSRNDLLHTALGIWALGTLGLLCALSAFSAEKTAPPSAPPRFERETEQKFSDLKTIIEDPSFDRLDGKGKSRKRVDLIEWEGNLEVHVYPAKSLQGLALKIDDRNTRRPVMVIGYRFDTAPKRQLIRRTLLGIPLRRGFKVYRDPSGGTEYDKIIISQSTLPKPLEEFKLDQEPDRLYPDGHPLNDSHESDAPKTPPHAQPISDSSEKRERTPATARQTLEPEGGTLDPSGGTLDEDTGSIRPFRW